MTKIYHSKRLMPKSDLGRESSLPKFSMTAEKGALTYGESLQGDDFENRMEDFSFGVLPYLHQDHYNRDQKEGEIKTIVLENDYLKATFYPEYGGRLASLWDKEKEKELLFDNPVFQPANLAIRNAWFSGGIEWNGPTYGHTFTTCTPIHFGVHEKDGTQILRIYDYDRYFNTCWQIDFELGKESRQLWYHVTLRNLSDKEVPLFWWTNIAAPINDKIRFLAQQDTCINHQVSQHIVEQDYPLWEGQDISYATKAENALSIFLVKKKEEFPWFSYADEDGYGLFHLSTKNLPGKKLWYFGSGDGGKNWMDKLSFEGQGDYIEIQAGVTDTQVQTLPFAANSKLCWTECIGPITCESSKVHGDYAEAVNHSEKEIESLGVMKELAARHTKMEKWQDDDLDEVIYKGQAWGRIFELSSGSKIPGVTFSQEMSDKEQPWLELLKEGSFSAATLNREPVSWMVNNSWKKLLDVSVTGKEATWLNSLYLGVIALENDNTKEAITHFEDSTRLKVNHQALRALAIIYFEAGEHAKSEDLYRQAWANSSASEDLYLEILGDNINREKIELVASYLSSCPPSLKEHEFVAIGNAILALQEGRYEDARTLLVRDYHYIREGSIAVTNLWFKSYRDEKSKELARELTQKEKDQLKLDFAPPKKIDFRMI